MKVPEASTTQQISLVWFRNLETEPYRAPLDSLFGPVAHPELDAGCGRYTGLSKECRDLRAAPVPKRTSLRLLCGGWFLLDFGGFGFRFFALALYEVGKMLALVA